MDRIVKDMLAKGMLAKDLLKNEMHADVAGGEKSHVA